MGVEDEPVPDACSAPALWPPSHRRRGTCAATTAGARTPDVDARRSGPPTVGRTPDTARAGFLHHHCPHQCYHHTYYHCQTKSHSRKQWRAQLLRAPNRSDSGADGSSLNLLRVKNYKNWAVNYRYLFVIRNFFKLQIATTNYIYFLIGRENKHFFRSHSTHL